MPSPPLLHPSPTLLFWNCNSLLAHRHDIGAIACPPAPIAPFSSAPLPPPPLLLAFAETKVVEPDKLPRIPDYTWHMTPALSSHSGGVALLMHESVASSCCSFPTLSDPLDPTDSSAILWVELRRPHHPPFLLGIVYLQPSPSSSCLDRLEDSVTTALATGLPLLLVGDFNLRHEEWDTALEEERSVSSAAARRFASFLSDHSLPVLNAVSGVSGYGTRGDAVLDLAITNESDISLVSDVSFPSPAIEAHLSSDHRPLLLSLRPHSLPLVSAAAATPVRVRWDVESMKEEDWTQFSEDLSGLLLQHFPYTSLTTDPEPVHASASLEDELERKYDSPSPPASPPATHSSATPPPLSVLHAASTVLEQCVLKAAYTHIRVKAIGGKYQHWWKYPGIRDAHTAYRQSFAAWRARPTVASHTAYTEARRQWKALVKEARRDEWKELCAMVQADPMSKLKWTVFKRTQPSSFAPLSSFRHPDTGALPVDRRESLNHLTQAFADSAVPPSSSSPSLSRRVDDYIRTLQQHPLPDHPSNEWQFTPDMVADQCRWQHTNTAAGPDSILPLFLKHGGEELYRALSCLYNYSWFHSVLPCAWRCANVAALYKGKGKRDSASSFRPVSVTSIVIRTFEHLLKGKLTQLVTASGYLHPHQFGFRAAHSTFDAISHLQSFVRASLRAKRAVPVAFLDLKKAFDRVWPERLVHLLQKAGIAGRAARWIYQFVTGRHFRVLDQNVAADWTPIHYGVPQGCVLSPLLFIIFINEVTRAIERVRVENGLSTVEPPVFILLYADDVALIPNTALRDWPRYFQAVLDGFTTWGERNRMEFSQDKSQIVYFTRSVTAAGKACPYTFTLSGFPLAVVDSYCYLGLWHQSNLHWTTHASKMLAKARSDSYLISRLVTPSAPPFFSSIRALCVGYLRPRCTYALAHWQPTESQLRKLQSAFVRPLLRVLSLPASANHLGTLVEANTPAFAVYRDYLLLRTLLRAAQLPPTHPSAHLYLQQLLLQDSDQPSSLVSTTAEAFQALNRWDLVDPTWPKWRAAAALKDVEESELPRRAMEQTIQRWLASPLRDPLDVPPLRSIKTTPGRSHYLYRPFFSSTSLRSRMRANRAFTNRYLHTTNRADADTCTLHSSCSAALLSQTVQHLLLHCPRYDAQRELLFDALTQLDPSLTLTLPLILGDVHPTRLSVS